MFKILSDDWKHPISEGWYSRKQKISFYKSLFCVLFLYNNKMKMSESKQTAIKPFKSDIQHSIQIQNTGFLTAKKDIQWSIVHKWKPDKPLNT